MKLALITDPKGFKTIDTTWFAYHLVLAQYVDKSPQFCDYYKEAGQRGHFLIMDNGAAETGTLTPNELIVAAEQINPDEIVLPDVLGNSSATIEASRNPVMLDFVPPHKRAIVPQGSNIEEWLNCANIMVNMLDFATLCIPKHLERFEGGRALILKMIGKLGWHREHHIHMLGLWGDPYTEIRSWGEYASIIRGLDTAAPFAFAQQGLTLGRQNQGHISHIWGKKFEAALALRNVETLWSWMRGPE